MSSEKRIDRLDKYMTVRGLNDNKLTVTLGLAVGTIGKSRAEGRDLSDKVVEKILNFYADLDRVWLLTGEGEMLKSGVTIGGDNVGGAIGNISVSGDHNQNVGNIRNSGRYDVVEGKRVAGKDIGVPYYDVDFIGSFDDVENDQTTTPTHYIDFPQYSKADSWVNVTGHSMEPLINHGDIIAIKKLEDWKTYLLYGEVYAIVTDEYRTIKYIRKSLKGEDYLRLVPANDQFDEQEIPKSVIRGVFQVLGCAKRL